MFTETISFQAAIIAGLLSFFSPCILPLIPAYFTFITGLSVDELTDNSKSTRQKVIMATFAYVCGFSFVFILLGASASFMGGLVSRHSEIIRFAGGTIILIFGVHLIGIINIKGLNFEKKIHIHEKPLHLFGTFIIGMAFGAGWTPCIGPMLGSILIIAGTEATVTRGILLLSVYSAGLALPFILMSFFISKIFEIMKRATKFIMYINKISGILLILVGVLLMTDNFTMLAGL